MKILQINKLYYPVIGGIETVVKDISEGLNKDNLDIDVLCCEIKGKRSVTEINNIKVYKAASFGKFFGMPLSFDFFRLFFKLKNNYDLFIFHFPFPLGAFLTFFIPKEKIIIYYHSDIVRQKFFSLPFMPVIYYSLIKAKKILVSGNNIIKSSKLLNKVKNKCDVVPLGFDLNVKDDYYIKTKEIVNKYGDNILLCVGRLVYYKGFEYAVEAMKNINATLLIIGDGPEKDLLYDKIRNLKLENKVFILPPQETLTPFFMACKIFIFPSTERSEAFGLVQLEAMACGKPIINTYLKTAVEEVSLNGITGITVTPKNYEKLAEAINRLLNDNDLYEKMSQNAEKRYREFFTRDKFLLGIKTVLK